MIPLSYKESLTYEEQILWLQNNLNDAIDLLNQLKEEFDNIDLNFDELEHEISLIKEDIYQICYETLIEFFDKIFGGLRKTRNTVQLDGLFAGFTKADDDFYEELTDLLSYYAWLIGYFLTFFVFLKGPANKHTANDNTSGVITLMEIMQALPEDKRNEIAFVFFDLEEMGLFGSSGFASKHKKAMKDKLLLNFDCVSDGSTILFAVKNSAKKYIPALEKSFIPCEKFAVDIASKGVFYPSDQANFKAGVGVAALNYSKKLRTLYMDKIHTDKDRVFDEENIEFLTAGAVRLREEL